MNWERLKLFTLNWSGFLLITPTIFLIISGIRLLGGFESFELEAFDFLLRKRPLEPNDQRIVIVTITETDIKKQKTYPFSDLTYAKLLTNIKAQKPRVIGLDIFRDQPVQPGHDQLVKVFRTTPNLIGIGKFTGKGEDSKIAPPPALQALGQVADSSGIIDADGVVRRGFLYPITSDKAAIPSLALALAYQYLDKEEIEPKPTEDGGWLQLGKARFYPFRKNDGGYVQEDEGSYQILLNWINPSSHFQQVSFSDVLANTIAPDLLRERVVLIGSVAPSLKDDFYTPFSNKKGKTSPSVTYGVEIQANLTSQIISAALDNRPMIRVWIDLLDYLWLFIWIVGTVGLIWLARNIESPVKLLIIATKEGILLTGLLIGSVYILFLNSWWIPLVPPFLSIWVSLVVTVIYIFVERNRNYIISLEETVQQRTQALRKSLQELEATQQHLIAQERLAYLGRLTAGFNHEIKNVLSIIGRTTEGSRFLLGTLRQIFSCQNLENGDFVEIEEILTLFLENLGLISAQVERVNEIRNSLLPDSFLDFNKRPALVKTDINKLLANAYKLVYLSQKSEIDSLNPQLKTDYDDSLETIEIVPNELTMVLINLIDNAWDAVVEKQKTQPENYTQTIYLSTKNKDELLEITVQDNGIGVSQELQAEVFKPFITTKLSKRGTGLGLSIAHDIIVGRYQGNIKMVIEAEHTKFILSFPKTIKRK